MFKKPPSEGFPLHNSASRLIMARILKTNVVHHILAKLVIIISMLIFIV